MIILNTTHCETITGTNIQHKLNKENRDNCFHNVFQFDFNGFPINWRSNVCVYFCFSSELDDNMVPFIVRSETHIFIMKYNDPLFTWPDFILFVVTQFTRNVDITSDVVDSFHT